ncbi:MAG: hypothetical protein LBE85_12680 [Candidatus Accumulibacter sp.]|jgi:hypothetical protein|nr:hypothetical protein [Accumulibacter sp.]
MNGIKEIDLVAPLSDRGPAPDEIEIVALRRLTLRCGTSSLTLHSDGRVLLRGENILSEAEARNHIVGGSVDIN